MRESRRSAEIGEAGGGGIKIKPDLKATKVKQSIYLLTKSSADSALLLSQDPKNDL